MRRGSLTLILLSSSAWLSATIITVNSTADTAANDGVCTLREAITAANTNTASGGAVGECAAGQAGPFVDQIAFNITGGCPTVCTITPATSLPPITDVVLIAGYTQPGASENTLDVGNDAVLRIELSGAVAGGTGLQLAAGSTTSTIRGMVINRFVDEILVQSDFNFILGNFIGVDPTGTVDLGLTGHGVHVTSGENSIGGAIPQTRNVISGNNGAGSPAGIFLDGPLAAGNVIQGNYIGTNAAGTAAIPNTFGINDEGGGSNVIGGIVVNLRNVISGNGDTGLRISGSDGNTVRGNYIGTNAAGTGALGNGSQGLRIDSGAGNTVGGAAAGEGNVISANADIGIRLTNASNTTVQGNIIGINATATVLLGNADGGVHVFGGSGNRIRSNVIFGNEGGAEPPSLGIDLDVDQAAPDDGPTPNDAGDADSGSNDLQNFPVLTAASLEAGVTILSGTLHSTPNTTFTLEFFVTDGCDPSGYGEGQTPIGTAMVTTDGSGDVTFGPLSFAASRKFATATATNPGNSTSEFSQCLIVTGVGQATPTPTLPGPTFTPTHTPTPTRTLPSATPTTTPTLIGGGEGPPPGTIPTLSGWMLLLFAAALATAGFLLMRRG